MSPPSDGDMAAYLLTLLRDEEIFPIDEDTSDSRRIASAGVFFNVEDK